MAAKAGEIARETSIYSCEDCRNNMHVFNGSPIGDCPECGCATFLTGGRTLKNQPTALPLVAAFP